jgi:hypothetical protein
MKDASTHPFTALRLRLLAVGEWLLVLPATVFLAAVAWGMSQARPYQPERVSWFVFAWAMWPFWGSGVDMLLLDLPAVVLLVGVVVLPMIWHNDQVLRQDVMACLVMIRQRLAIGFLAVATLLGGGILLIVLAHMIAS